MNTPTERITKLFDYPYGSYLMLRLEYACICNDELEAMIMRLIEMRVDDERKRMYQKQINDMPKGTTPPEQLVDVEKSLWVQISHRLFMYDLYGLVKSENTLKKALKSLLAKKFIFVRHNPKSRYDPPEYQLNVELIQKEFDKLSKDKRGYQPLTPSIPDTLNNRDHQNLTPSEGQELTPSSETRVSEVDPNSRTGNGNNITVKQERESDTPTNTQPPTFDVPVVTSAPSQDVSSEEKQAPDRVDHNTPQSDATLPVEPTLNVRIAPTSAPDNANKQDEQGNGKGQRGKAKVTLTAEEKALRTKLQERINRARGYSLRGSATKEAIFAEQNAVETLAHKLYLYIEQGDVESGYSWEEMVYLHGYVKKKDPYWSKPENVGRIGGYAMLQKAAEVIHDRRVQQGKIGKDTPFDDETVVQPSEKPRPTMWIAGLGAQTPERLPVAPRPQRRKVAQ